jgi:hypothetical protein
MDRFLERMHILDCFDKCMDEMIVCYSKNIKKFELYPSEEKAAHDQHIRSKIEKINPQMFYQVFDNFNRLDTNKFNFWKTDRTGKYYNRLIQIYPYYCNCPTFWDHHYCHHILAIIKFKFANIVINPLKTLKEPARLLVARKARGHRNKKTKGALNKE